MLQEKKRTALIGILGGSVLQIAAYAAIVTSTSLTFMLVGALIGLAGFVMLMYGSAAFATGKGYPAWLGVLLVWLLSWIGLIILAVLPDKTKRSSLTSAPLMADAGAYDPNYGAVGTPSPAYDGPSAYPVPGAQMRVPAPAPVGGNGNGNGYSDPDSAPLSPGGGTSSSFDQPAPDFQWGPGSRPTPAAAYAAEPVAAYSQEPLAAYAAAPASAPMPSSPSPASVPGAPPIAAPQPAPGAASLPNWPPAGHWSMPQG